MKPAILLLLLLAETLGERSPHLALIGDPGRGGAGPGSPAHSRPVSAGCARAWAGPAVLECWFVQDAGGGRLDKLPAALLLRPASGPAPPRPDLDPRFYLQVHGESSFSLGPSTPPGHPVSRSPLGSRVDLGGSPPAPQRLRTRLHPAPRPGGLPPGRLPALPPGWPRAALRDEQLRPAARVRALGRRPHPRAQLPAEPRRRLVLGQRHQPAAQPGLPPAPAARALRGLGVHSRYR